MKSEFKIVKRTPCGLASELCGAGIVFVCVGIPLFAFGYALQASGGLLATMLYLLYRVVVITNSHRPRTKIDLDQLSKSKAVSISRPPGSRLNTFAQTVYTKKAYERVFQQWIIDWREEHAEALSRKHFGLARWRHFSGYVVFVSMMVTHAVSTVLRGVKNVWRATGGG